jgi:hypothetical protein
MSEGDKTMIEDIMDKTGIGHECSESIGLRGGIEVMLKNALTGETILHGKGPNNVLYIGRNMIMTRAFTSASQTNILNACIVVGGGSTASQGTHTGPITYRTYKTATMNTTTASDGSVQPILNWVASWESTELNDTMFNTIWEFLLKFGPSTNSTASAGAPYLCRYLSGSAINATTSNQLLVTYTVSF